MGIQLHIEVRLAIVMFLGFIFIMKSMGEYQGFLKIWNPNDHISVNLIP